MKFGPATVTVTPPNGPAPAPLRLTVPASCPPDGRSTIVCGLDSTPWSSRTVTFVVRNPSAPTAREKVPGVIRLSSSNDPATLPDGSPADSVTVVDTLVPSLATTRAPAIGLPEPSDTVPVILPSPFSRSRTMSVSESPGWSETARGRLTKPVLVAVRT